MIAEEMFKVYRNISSPICSEIFHRRDINYNLRTQSEFPVPNIRSVFHGSESISYLGPKTKELVSFEILKKSIKDWKPKNCS